MDTERRYCETSIQLCLSSKQLTVLSLYKGGREFVSHVSVESSREGMIDSSGDRRSGDLFPIRKGSFEVLGIMYRVGL